MAKPLSILVLIAAAWALTVRANECSVYSAPGAVQSVWQVGMSPAGPWSVQEVDHRASLEWFAGSSPPYRPDVRVYRVRVADTSVAVAVNRADWDVDTYGPDGDYARAGAEIVARTLAVYPSFVVRALSGSWPDALVFHFTRLSGCCRATMHRNWEVEGQTYANAIELSYDFLGAQDFNELPEQWEETVAHEIGHYFDNIARATGGVTFDDGRVPGRVSWHEAVQADGVHVTEYAATSPLEDFAESFLAWLALRMVSPVAGDNESTHLACMRERVELIPARLAWFDARYREAVRSPLRTFLQYDRRIAADVYDRSR